jgi:hypothetical protein
MNVDRNSGGPGDYGEPKKPDNVTPISDSEQQRRNEVTRLNALFERSQRETWKEQTWAQRQDTVQRGIREANKRWEKGYAEYRNNFKQGIGETRKNTAIISATALAAAALASHLSASGEHGNQTPEDTSSGIAVYGPAIAGMETTQCTTDGLGGSEVICELGPKKADGELIGSVGKTGNGVYFDGKSERDAGIQVHGEGQKILAPNEKERIPLLDKNDHDTGKSIYLTDTDPQNPHSRIKASITEKPDANPVG